jgi:hypothetical protein
MARGAGMRKLEWILSLRDRVSGPARQASKGLDSFRQSLRRSQQFAGRANVNRRLTRGFADIVRSLNRPTMNPVATLREQFTEALPMLTGTLAAVGSAAIAAAAGIARLGVAFGAAVVSEAAFQESSLATLRTFLGSQRAAREEFARSLAFARQTPLDTGDVIRMRLRLVSSGFRESRERDVMSNVLSDIAAANGGNMENAMNALRGFSQMRASGRFNAQDFNQIRDASGVNQRDVFLRLARMRGLRGTDDSLVRQVEQLRQHRQINSSQAEVAIVEALRAQFGGGAAGSLTAAQSGTITGLLSNLRSSFSDLMQGLDLGSLPGIKTFRGFLADLVQSLSAGSTTGKRLQGILARVIDLLGGGLRGADPAAVLSQALDVLDRLIDGGLYLWNNVFKPLGEGLRQGFGDAMVGILPLLRRFLETGTKGTKTADFFRTLGRVLGFVAGALVLAYGAFVAVGGVMLNVASHVAPLINGFMDARTAVLGWVMALTDYLPGGKYDLAKRFQLLGASIVDGLVAGLDAGAARIGEAMLRLAGGILDGITNPLEIHSPSRVMERLGRFTAQGFEQGLRGESAGMIAALEGMVAAPRAELPAPGALAGLGAGITVTIQVDARGRDDAEEVGDVFEERALRLLVDALTRLGLMQGATGG